ncbi:response regulator [Candidatus Thioglobus sp.]|uniref:response regulator transcription factor n=1 Tax=Candidatus Thioglobus sp. TaxID=2026721 RepID=UPI002638DDC0|nr:response regulator [Candidatus Thioglobus sp.]
MNPATIDQQLLTRTIYIIDDDGDILQSLTDFFQLKGFKVKSFCSALDYLAALDNKPGLVISDISMPQMSGIQLLEKLNECQHLRPVLFMTGVASIELAVEAMQLGARDFIEKPFSTRVLLDKVIEILKQSEQQFSIAERRHSLTKREAQVFDLVIDGLSNSAISESLFITVSTVEKHRAMMMRKMQVMSLNELFELSKNMKKLP